MFDMEYVPVEIPCMSRNGKYSKNVLVGCWFDERVAAEEEEEKLLKYGGRKPCEKHSSIYRSHFQQGNTRRDAADDYMATRLKAFANLLKGHHSNITFFDHKEYLKNMATTHDIGYRIMPDFYRVTNKDPKPEHGFDYSRAMGNITTTGARHHLKQEIKEQSPDAVPYSTYQLSYAFKDKKC